MNICPLPSSASTSNLLRWAVWALIVVFCLYEFSLALHPRGMTEGLKEALHTNTETIELLLECFLYLYIPTQLPIAGILRRCGARSLLLGAFSICLFSACLFGFATTPTILAAARLLLGIGSSFAFVGLLVMAFPWIPHPPLSMVLSVVNACAMIGAASSGGGWSGAEEWFAQKHVLLTLGGCALALSLWIVHMLPHTSPHLAPFSPKPTKIFSTVRAHLQAFWRQPHSWSKQVLIFAVYWIAYSFVNPFGDPSQGYLGFRQELAGFATALLYMEWIFDRPVRGELIERLGCGRFFVTIGSMLGLLCFSSFIAIPSLLLLLFATTLFFTGLSSPEGFFFPSLWTEMDGALAGSLVSFAHTLFQPLIGIILDLFWLQGGQMLWLDDSLPMFILLPLGCIGICLLKGRGKLQNLFSHG